MTESIYQALSLRGAHLGRVDREAFIESLCRDRSCLHVGCSDWPVTAERIANGSLLHLRLARVCRELHGADVSVQGMNLLESCGLSNLHMADAETLSASFPTKRFDVVVAGEVLEHLANPGLAFREMSACLTENGQLIVTVPNALSVELFLYALRGEERVHRDHNTYFSPKTIVALAGRYGLVPTQIGFSNRGSVSGLRWRVVKALENWRPHLSRSVIVVFERQPQPQAKEQIVLR